MKRFFLIVLLSTIAVTASYFAFLNYQSENTPKSQEVVKEEPKVEEKKEEEIPAPPQTITYDETPATKDAKYFEKVVKVGSEFVYLAYPLTVDKGNPTKLVVYSHGSNTTVSRNFTDPFMKDMQMYGEYFTKRGYAFSASSMHGANWGNDASVADIYSMYKWIGQRYLIDEKMNLFGFSLGGLPTFNFAFKYPKLVNSIALLAPTSRDYTLDQLTLIKRIPIQIWHGDKDVNVPLSLSTSLSQRYNSFEFKNLELEIIEGAGHFDIDTELKKEVVVFFTAHE